MENQILEKKQPPKYAGYIVIGVFVLIIISIINMCNDGGENTTNNDDKKNKKILKEYVEFKDFKIETLKSGDKLFFGSGLDTIEVVILDSNKANVNYHHLWKFQGREDDIRSKIEEGTYIYSIIDANTIETDNNYWPPIAKAMLLENNNFGFANGYKSLNKKFLISRNKSKSQDSYQLRIYPWLNPEEYPSRNGEFAFNTSQEIRQINLK